MRSGLDRQRLRMSLVIACIAGRFATGSDVSRPSVGSRVGAFLLFFIPQIFVQSLASCRRSLRRFAPDCSQRRKICKGREKQT